MSGFTYLINESLIDNDIRAAAEAPAYSDQQCWFVGALAYADDLVLLAPSATAMRRLLSVCDS